MASIECRPAGFMGGVLAVALGVVARPAIPADSPAQSLRDRYAALQAKLEQGPYQRPLYLQSVERSRSWQGDIYSLVEHPYASVTGALTSANSWCDALILHLNVKYCHVDTGAEGAVVSIAIGRKYFQPLDKTHRVEFTYTVAASEADYVDVVLDAARGPFGTRNYRIALEAVPIDDGHTFVHLGYSSSYGLQGHLAMGAYVATIGGGKVGFTEIERTDLGALATAEPQRFEHSLDLWFTATELYPRQLHEVDRDAYLAMKRREYLRQQERK